MADTPDGCVVQTVPLAAIVRDFVSTYLRERPSTKGRRKRRDDVGEDVTLGPYEALAVYTGLPEKQIRQVRNPARHPLTELRVADALVAAIGADPLLFHDGGALAPMPNPKAPVERQRECCGGSGSSFTGTGAACQ